MIPDELLLADRDQHFSDWAETVTLRTVTSTYDPETLATVESFSDAACLALVAPRAAAPTPTTAGHHQTEELSVTLRSEDLSTFPPPPLLRVLYDNIAYQVVRSTASPAARLVTLHARRIE